ncbi:MAG: hypothetical protein NT174_07175 [Actinobacteria bacterium]|nr:hypothetical protein [Actinomycetota bacterium]
MRTRSFVVVFALLASALVGFNSAHARTLSLPVILDMCKTASQTNCIDSVYSVNDASAEQKATLVSTPTLGYTIIGDGSRLTSVQIPSPQPHLRIPGLVNSDGAGVVELRVFFAADPWTSFGTGQPLSSNPPSLSAEILPVTAKTDKAMPSLQTTCSGSSAGFCGSYPAPLGDQVRIKLNLRLSKWSAKAYQIAGNDIDATGTSTKSGATVSITARPAKGAFRSDFYAGGGLNGGSIAATAVTTAWGFSAEPNTSPTCRSGFYAIGGSEAGSKNGGEFAIKGMPRLVGMHFPVITGLDGAPMASTLEFVLQQRELDCMWPSVSRADLVKNLRQMVLAGPKAIERAVVVTDLGDRIRVQLGSSNLLPGKNDGFALTLAGDNDLSNWVLPK